MSFLRKTQRFVAKAIERQRQKPKKTRQKILLGGIVFTATLLIFFWIWQLKASLLQVGVEGLPKPEIEIEGLQNFKGLVEEFKNISEENLKELEVSSKNLEKLKENQKQKNRNKNSKMQK